MRKGYIVAVLSTVGVVIGALAVRNAVSKKNVKMKEMSDKHLALFLMMNQWVKVKQEGKNIATYLQQNGYKRIAVYGMSYVGETLVNDLKQSGIEVAYAIDKNANSICADVNIVSMEDEMDTVDTVIVTAITYFDEIKSHLIDKVNCPILSLEDILYYI